MKASGTAAKARQDGAHGKALPAKPAARSAARAQAKSVPAAVKKAAKPVAARAAATAVATKSASVAKKAVPAATPKQPDLAQAAEPATRPAMGAPAAEAAKPSAAKPRPTTETMKQPAAAKPSAAPAATKPPAEGRPAHVKPTGPKLADTKPAVDKAAAPDLLAPAAEASLATAAQTPAAPAEAEAVAPAQPPPRAPADAARRPGTPGMHTGPLTAPRIPAKAEVFQEGDHVVYPTHGVGKVERIATEEIAGHKLDLIHITFEENRMTLRVPVAKARTAGLRKLATRKLFDEALNVLKGRARIKRTMWSRRAQEYEAKINSGDPLAIAEVVRDLHRNAGQPDQSFSERQIYEAAMERLAAELAALDKTDKATAATKLTDFLKTV